MRLHEGGAPAVDERDHGNPVGDRVAVGLVEALETAAVAALLARPLDEDVERGVGEASLVRPARRLEQQAQEVLGVRVARQPARDPQVRRVDPAPELHRLLVPPRPRACRDPVSEDLAPATGHRLEDGVPHHHPRQLEFALEA